MERSLPKKPAKKPTKGRRLNLTRLQEAWAHHYAETGNAVLAAQRAGYEGDYDTLKGAGYRNKTTPAVQERLKEIFAARAMGEEEFRGLVGDLARASIEVVLDGDKISIERARQLGALGLIKEYSTESAGDGILRSKVKLHDRLRALQMAGEILGAFAPKKIEHSGSVSLEDVKAAQALLPPTRPEEEDD